MAKRCRQFSAQFKFDVVIQWLAGEKTLAELSREHQIKDSLLCRWRQELLERGPHIFAGRRGDGAVEQERIAELERVVGRLTIELEATKKASSLLTSRWRSGER
jgi:transposase-like protein